MSGSYDTAKRAASVFAIAALLAGCATTAAQREYQTMVSNDRTAVQDLQACTLAVYDSPEFAPLRRHAPYKATDATLEQLSDNSLATDDEIKLILENHPKIQACRKQAFDRISQSTPTLVPIMLAYITKTEDSLVDLIQKKQSWGAHVRRVRDATITGTAELQAEERRIVAGLQQTHEAELAQRQAAAAAFAQYSQTQQVIGDMANPFAASAAEARRQLQLYNDAFMIRSMQPPTRCSWIGQIWTCQ
jgi:hypothetical protein